jgi:hypothetical protein
MIRLNNGGTLITIPSGKNFKLGETVHVCWDYTANRPRSVISDAEYHAPHEVDYGLAEEDQPPDWTGELEWEEDS